MRWIVFAVLLLVAQPLVAGLSVSNSRTAFALTRRPGLAWALGTGFDLLMFTVVIGPSRGWEAGWPWLVLDAYYLLLIGLSAFARLMAVMAP